MITVTFLQGLYITDFFLNERWYLATIDIANDVRGETDKRFECHEIVADQATG